MYDNGVDAPKDTAEAIRWYRIAAEQGNREAQLLLGLIYSQGQRVPRDHIQAYKWFSLFVSSFDGDGIVDLRESFMRERDSIAEKMDSADLSQAQRLVADWQVGSH